MKIFEGNAPQSWEGKINFVDRNNVVVGLDSYQSCCESFGYLITVGLPKENQRDSDDAALEDLDAFVFATTSDPVRSTLSDLSGEDANGDSISFRLVADGKPDRYLTLYNFHNGYYSHGFDMKDNGKPLLDGSL